MNQRLRVASIAGATLCLSLAADSARAQDHAEDDHDFHHHHMGVLVGGMTPLSETSETSFALGAEYEYRFSEKWGTGLGVDFTFGDHKRTALVATGVSYRLTPSFKVGTSPRGGRCRTSFRTSSRPSRRVRDCSRCATAPPPTPACRPR